MSEMFRIELLIWCVRITSLGFLIVSQTEVIKTGATMIPETAIVQNKEEGNTIHPNNIIVVNATGTRLRLILSNIFQRDNPETGFLYQCFPMPGTTGKNQGKICQSPRIQRERLFISAR